MKLKTLPFTLTVWFILSTALSPCIFAQTAKNLIRFDYLTTNEGLSQNTVFDTAQDSIGNLWIATADGLNRFDGYFFSVYRSDLSDKNSLLSDYTRCLQVTPDNKLLIGNLLGLSVYSIKDDSFFNFNIDQVINHISKFSDDLYYLTSQNRLFEYSLTNNTLVDVSPDSSNSEYFCTLGYDGILYVGMSNGVYILEDKQLKPYYLTNAPINNMLVRDDCLWIATEGDGVLQLRLTTGKRVSQFIQSTNSNNLISSYVRTLAFDNYDRLWIGTMRGLSLYDFKTKQFSNYTASTNFMAPLSQNSIRKIFIDNQDGVWLGTYFGGLNYYHPLRNQFGEMRHTETGNSLSSNNISCIVGDSKRNEVWFGTNESGLNRYNKTTNQFKLYNFFGGLNSNNIKAVLLKDNKVYVGSHGGGLSWINLENDKISNLKENTSQLKSNDVYRLLSTEGSQTIWVGTLEGLQLYDIKTQLFSDLETLKPIGVDTKNHLSMLRKSRIYELFKDTNDNIWISAESGVFSYSLRNGLLAFYDIKLDNKHVKINCFQEDQRGRLWIGTNLGLAILKNQVDSMKFYTTKDGLPNNYIYGILRDNQNQLWISTNDGLASLSDDMSKIRLYGNKDGIINKQFNEYAFYREESGRMYFGGLDGVTYFTPEKLIDNPFSPTPAISNLSIYNKIITPLGDPNILTANINYSELVTLPPNKTSFSLLPTVSNFLSNKYNTFAYKLEPLESEWNIITDAYPITYSHLEPGKYLFRLKSANSDGKWSEKEKTITINILPNWWNTWWFKTFILIIIGLIGYQILSLYRKKYKLKTLMHIKQIEYEKEAEINQSKLRFFINISHEFRTPLTLILSPLKEVITKTSDKWTSNQLKIVYKNANRLAYYVDQLMNYRKADLGIFALNVTQQNPKAQIEKLIEMFRPLALQKNISIEYQTDLNDNDTVWFDSNYIDLILSNLISNAFKFTQNKGSIIIRTVLDGNIFRISVQDTGKGISAENSSRIFDQFFRVSAKVKGTGVGLSFVKKLVDLHHAIITVDSIIEKGTVFTINITQDLNHYNTHEIGNNSENKELIEQTLSDLLDQTAVDIPQELAGIDNLKVELGNDIKILIVEDDHDILQYIADNLNDLGYVFLAESAEKALEVIQDKEIDLIISDVMLPGMNGITFCKHIKQNIKTSHIPVIILTAIANIENKMEALQAGAEIYITKPFNLPILKITIRNILRARYSIKHYYAKDIQTDLTNLALNNQDKEFLDKAQEIVIKNIDNNSFSVETFCQEMAMSRSSLHLRMKAVTGEPTSEFIKKVRFNEACKLLQEGKYSITEISSMVGFNTVSYFSTSFKNYFGVMPSEYQQNQKL